MKQFCYRCHQYFSQNKLKFIRGKDIFVCSDCAYEKFLECDICHEYFSENDLVYTDDDKAVCVWCVSEKYAVCPHCGIFISESDAIEFHGHFMCASCKQEYFEKCYMCGNLFEHDDLEEVTLDDDDIKLCQECLKKSHVHCETCDEKILKQNACTYKDKFYCSNCYESEFVKCPCCLNMVPHNNTEMITVGGKDFDVCPDCIDKYNDCYECCNTFPQKKLYKWNGDYFCEECLKKLIGQMNEVDRKTALRDIAEIGSGVLAGAELLNMLNMDSKSYSSANEIIDDDDDEYIGDYSDGFNGWGVK